LFKKLPSGGQKISEYRGTLTFHNRKLFVAKTVLNKKEMCGNIGQGQPSFDVDSLEMKTLIFDGRYSTIYIVSQIQKI
jgi:hypothetical protein